MGRGSPDQVVFDLPVSVEDHRHAVLAPEEFLKLKSALRLSDAAHRNLRLFYPSVIPPISHIQKCRNDFQQQQQHPNLRVLLNDSDDVVGVSFDPIFQLKSYFQHNAEMLISSLHSFQLGTIKEDRFSATEDIQISFDGHLYNDNRSELSFCLKAGHIFSQELKHRILTAVIFTEEKTQALASSLRDLDQQLKSLNGTTLEITPLSPFKVNSSEINKINIKLNFIIGTDMKALLLLLGVTREEFCWCCTLQRTERLDSLVTNFLPSESAEEEMEEALECHRRVTSDDDLFGWIPIENRVIDTLHLNMRMVEWFFRILLNTCAAWKLKAYICGRFRAHHVFLHDNPIKTKFDGTRAETVLTLLAQQDGVLGELKEQVSQRAATATRATLLLVWLDRRDEVNKLHRAAQCFESIMSILHRRDRLPDSAISTVADQIDDLIQDLAPFIITHNSAPFYLHSLHFHLIPILKKFRHISGFQLQSHEHYNQFLNQLHQQSNHGGGKRKPVVLQTFDHAQEQIPPAVANLASVLVGAQLRREGEEMIEAKRRKTKQ